MKLVLLATLFFLSELALTAQTKIDITEGKSRAFSPEIIGYNANLAGYRKNQSESGQDEKIGKLLAAMKPGTLRYPAGTLANYWDWRTGLFLEKIPAKDLPYGLRSSNMEPYPLSRLKKMCDQTGAIPVWLLNMMYSDLGEQLAMLREGKRLGLQIRYVELGNEFYLEKPDNIEKFPQAEDYARTCREWMPAIRAEFPEAKICVLGAAVRQGDAPRRSTWNEKILPLVAGADAISLHVYQGTGLGAIADRLMEAAGLVKTKEQGGGGMWASTEKQRAQLEAFQKPEGLRNMLGMPFQRMTEFPEPATVPAGMQVWVTEYNLFDRVGPGRGTWAHGLFAASLTLGFLARENVSLLVYHELINNPGFFAIISSADAYEKAYGFNGQTEPFSYSGQGLAMKFLGEAILEKTSAASLAFSPNPEIVSDNSKYPSLTGFRFSAQDKNEIVVVNVSEKALPLSFQKMFPGQKLRSLTLSADPRLLVTGAGQVKESAGSASSDCEIPPYSMMRFFL